MARLVPRLACESKRRGGANTCASASLFRENEGGGNVNEHGRASERGFVFFFFVVDGFFLFIIYLIFFKSGICFCVFFIFGLIFFQKRTHRLGIKRVSQHENTEECNYHFARQLLL